MKKFRPPIFLIFSLGLGFYTYFFWQLPETTPSLLLLKFLCQYLFLFAMGLEGFTPGETRPRHLNSYILLATFFLMLFYQAWQLLS